MRFIVMFVTAVCVLSVNFVYGKYISPYLFPAFDHFGVLLSVKKKQKQIYVCFLGVCPLIDENLRRNIVKVYC